MDARQTTYNYAMSFVGKPYIWGGKNPIVGMDCSGLVCELLHSLGILESGVEDNAQSLYSAFAPKSLLVKVPMFGSLIFYGGDLRTINHVAFGLNSLQMIEAGGGTSQVVSPETANKANAFVKVRPYTHRKDLVAILNPAYYWST